MEAFFQLRTLALLAGGLVIAAGLLSARMVMAAQVEEPNYRVVQSFDDFEIREYQHSIQAQAYIPSNSRDSMSTGFRTLAGYIFGGNNQSQKIAMTAPVSQQRAGSGYLMTFTLPVQYEMEELPRPDNSAVTLKEVPGSTMAAMRFNGRAYVARADEKRQALLAALEREGISVEEAPILAQYDPPMQLPFLRRNEILIRIGPVVLQEATP